MPMPIWWGQINKRVFNPAALQNGKWTTLQHVGRSSGRAYRTPIGTWRVADTYYVIVVYGPKTDWLQNVLATGSAILEVNGVEVPVTNLRLVPIDDGFRGAPPGVSRPPRFLRISQCLAMDVARDLSGSEQSDAVPEGSDRLNRSNPGDRQNARRPGPAAPTPP